MKDGSSNSFVNYWRKKDLLGSLVCKERVDRSEAHTNTSQVEREEKKKLEREGESREREKERRKYLEGSLQKCFLRSILITSFRVASCKSVARLLAHCLLHASLSSDFYYRRRNRISSSL